MGKLDLLIDGELRAIEKAFDVLLKLDCEQLFEFEVRATDLHFAEMLLIHIEAEKQRRFGSDLPW